MFASLLELLSHVVFFALHLMNPGSFPRPLTAEQERDALVRFHEHGDQQARSLLIEHNLRLVAHIVKKYQNATQDQDDLISIGTIGLIKAVGTFDHTKGARLATYASRCIENEILMHLRKIAGQPGELSIDEPLNVDRDGNELLLSDVLGGDPDVVSQDLEQEAERSVLLACVTKLSDREQQILRLRFGLYGAKEHTQKEVADLLGISQSYISRLEKKIIKRLKNDMEKAGCS